MSYFTTINLNDVYGQVGHFTPSYALQVAQPYRLVGTTFGTTNDAVFWTPANVGGTATVGSGIATVVSGTVAANYGKFTSVRPARFVIDEPHKFRGLMRLTATTVANTVRAWGPVVLSPAVTPINGLYYSVDGTGALSVNTVTASVVTSVASGSFNGASPTYTVDTNEHIYDIVYSVSGIWFAIDGVLIHKITLTTAPFSTVVDLPINFWATSTGTSAGATLQCWGAAIHRLGRDLSAPVGTYVTGAATTTLKTGSGIVQSMNISAITNNSTVLLYDATTAVAPIIYGFNSGNVNQTSPVNFGGGLPFYTGLTMVTVGAGIQVTIVYE
jgi:hypothetical protein